MLHNGGLSGKREGHTGRINQMTGRSRIGPSATAVSRRALLGAAAIVGVPSLPRSGRTQQRPIRIGVLNDQTGLYRDFSGPTSVLAARMAAEDMGGSVLGRPIEVIDADHQNKPDVAAAIARAWFDRDGVSAVADLTNSAVALAVQR